MTAFVCNICGEASNTNPNARMGWIILRHENKPEMHFCQFKCLKVWVNGLD